MVVICGLYDGHLLPIYLLQAIYSFSRDRHSTPVPIRLPYPPRSHTVWYITTGKPKGDRRETPSQIRIWTEIVQLSTVIEPELLFPAMTFSCYLQRTFRAGKPLDLRHVKRCQFVQMLLYDRTTVEKSDMSCNHRQTVMREMDTHTYIIVEHRNPHHWH